jgi:predicted nucleic acid-binding protein
MAERRKRITQADARAILHLIRQLPVHIDGELALHAFDTVSALARQFALTTYDAAYLELAMRRRASLATLDASLRKAAVNAGVTVCE